MENEKRKMKERKVLEYELRFVLFTNFFTAVNF